MATRQKTLPAVRSLTHPIWPQRLENNVAQFSNVRHADAPELGDHWSGDESDGHNGSSAVSVLSAHMPSDDVTLFRYADAF